MGQSVPLFHASVPPDAAPPEEPQPRRKWMSRERVASFKKARPWLLERLDALLAAGWTRDELFRVRKPLGHPYCWGVAWRDAWRTSDRVVLLASGCIAFSHGRPGGGESTLHAWPESYPHARSK